MQFTRTGNNPRQGAMSFYAQKEQEHGLPEGSLTGQKPVEVAKKGKGFFSKLFNR
jgi:hypothetical protein